ncbi:MAG: hypothetical protein CO093_00400 [Alphaproteobacteria bacterium CG_4_9_14_3_um_filter_47_13]|nr:MAG: hypothetical protein CO093_00400 [Alphaproteobacteria bacterium CG_4_9_14_3_um_filter_47_13]
MNLLKTLCLIIFLTGIGALPASAQTPIGKEQASNFYNSCKSRQDPRMTPQIQDDFCACTATHMMATMSIEDIQIMTGNTPEAKTMQNKMLLDVYTPCMNYPTQSLVKGECQKNAAIAKASKENLCNCMAEKTGLWFTKEGRALMQRVINENPDVFDPIDPVMESPEFKTQSYNNMLACMAGGHK